MATDDGINVEDEREGSGLVPRFLGGWAVLSFGAEFLIIPGHSVTPLYFHMGFSLSGTTASLTPSHSSFKNQLRITSLGGKPLLCVYRSPCDYSYCTVKQLSVLLIKNILRKWQFIWKELIVTLSYNQDFLNPVIDRLSQQVYYYTYEVHTNVVDVNTGQHITATRMQIKVSGWTSNHFHNCPLQWKPVSFGENSYGLGLEDAGVNLGSAVHWWGDPQRVILPLCISFSAYEFEST